MLVLGVLGNAENISDHGSSKVHPNYTVTPLKGLMKKMPTRWSGIMTAQISEKRAKWRKRRTQS